MSPGLYCRCGDQGALCHPYYRCSRCGLDFDDETFYQRKESTRPRRDSMQPRRRMLDTICKACRQKERDDGKGPTPTTDWAKVEYGRFMQAARRTIAHHASRFNLSTHDLAKQGWLAPLIADRMQRTKVCEYCHRHFASLDDQTIDVVVPKLGFSFELNTRVADTTCNNAKRVFENEPNAQQLIDRWRMNWRRWGAHQRCPGRVTHTDGDFAPPPGFKVGPQQGLFAS